MDQTLRFVLNTLILDKKNIISLKMISKIDNITEKIYFIYTKQFTQFSNFFTLKKKSKHHRVTHLSISNISFKLLEKFYQFHMLPYDFHPSITYIKHRKNFQTEKLYKLKKKHTYHRSASRHFYYKLKSQTRN